MQELVELPIELQNFILLGIQIVVVFALTQLSKWLSVDLSGYATQAAAAIFSAVLVVVNVLLSKIPVGYEAVAAGILNFIVVLLGAFGLYKVYRQRFPKKPLG